MEWFTRRSQKPMSASSCGFDSHLAHPMPKVTLYNFIKYLILILGFLFFGISGIITTFTFPFYLTPYLAVLLFDLSLVIMGTFIYMFIGKSNKETLKRVLKVSYKKRRNKYTFFIIIFIIFGMIFPSFYALFLISSKIYTNKIITEGTVVEKSEKQIYWYAGKLLRPFPIFEIKIETEDDKMLSFNLNLYKQEWSKIDVGDTLEIEHYPLIRDRELKILSNNINN